MAQQGLTIFDILKDINFIKSNNLHKSKEFENAYDDFMINRYLSMDCETVLEANFMNKRGIPKQAQYLFLSHVIEKKNRFLKYIKKDKVDKKKNELVKNIMDLYAINRIDAIQIYDIIPDEEKKIITEIYKIQKKATRR